MHALHQLMFHATGGSQTVKRIHNVDQLQKFVANLRANPAAGHPVDTFQISIQDGGCDINYDVINQCLRLMPRLTDLILELPSPFPSLPLVMDRVLTGIELPFLQLLKTNLRTSALIPFLRNPLNMQNLTFLVLDHQDCGALTTDLPGILTFECSVRTIVQISSPHVQRLTLRNNSPHIFTSLALQQATPLHYLANLSLQFFSNDYDVLDKVVAFAPRLRKLRLMELVVHTRNGRIPGRRVWKAVSHMAASLKKLPLLQELMLDSVHDLVQANNPRLRRMQEERLIRGWLTGRCKASSKASSGDKYHPSLYRISLFYGRNCPSTQTLSIWAGKFETWERDVHQFGRMEDVVL